MECGVETSFRLDSGKFDPTSSIIQNMATWQLFRSVSAAVPLKGAQKLVQHAESVTYHKVHETLHSHQNSAEFLSFSCLFLS